MLHWFQSNGRRRNAHTNFRRRRARYIVLLKTFVFGGGKYSANDRELLGLIYFLQRFRCYFEGSEFEVLTDNQVLERSLTKPNPGRWEARWLDFLGRFSITSLTLEKGKVHVLGDSLSRAPQLIVKNIETSRAALLVSVLFETHCLKHTLKQTGTTYRNERKLWMRPILWTILLRAKRKISQNQGTARQSHENFFRFQNGGRTNEISR